MDFQKLRREGIRHIERLGSAIWTDYNEHDPGITMLEVLDYAITDLGYRTNWEPAELFALPTQRQPYPTAVDILTNGPVTALDLRKLLIDLDGVRNAWIECRDEPLVWIQFDAEGQRLVAEKIPTEPPTPPTPTDNLFTPRGIYTILLELEEADEEDADAIKRTALARLNQYRNLCEVIDPVIKILDTEPVGVCATLEFAPDADPDAVLAAVISAIDDFLAPPVRFYTLQERLDKYGRFQLTDDSLTNLSDAALPAELLTLLKPLANQEIVSKTAFLDTVRVAIGDTALADYEALIFFHTAKNYDAHPVYQGPLLDHGFVDEDELAAAQLRRTVYKSDIYQVILGVTGVVGIQNLDIGKCKTDADGASSLEIAGWCLSFDCECQLRFDADCSTFFYAKGNSYTRLDMGKAALEARWLQMRQNFSVFQKADLDLVAPSAQFRPDFLDYTSVQDDFPQTYHIGRDGLASNESALRKAQAKQLKGYLLFYDQILANYLAQLANVRELLAVDGQTRFPAGFLSLKENVPNGQPLFLDTYNLENADFRTLMEGVELEQQLYQSRLMDHLLARFGEQFTDYVLTLYQTDKLIDEGDLVGNGLADWIADKQNLLTNVPPLGSQRARGFNYRAAPQARNAHIWNPDEAHQPPALLANVEGVKQRVCALLGIADASRHTITCEPDFFSDVFLSPETRARRYRFGVKADENDPAYILVSTAWYARADVADTARLAFENLSLDTSRYAVIGEPNTDRFVLGFWVKPASAEPRTYDNALLRSPKAYEQTDAQERLDRFKKRIEETCQDDSFHIIEHILLRPLNEHYTPLLTPLATALPADPVDNRWLDPYSFRISVVVPDWVERYRDEQQFYLFGQTLRAETPAHIAVSICRYNREQMLAFETAYYNFLVEQSFPRPEPDDVQRVTNELVTVLNANRSQCMTTNPKKPARPTC